MLSFTQRGALFSHIPKTLAGVTLPIWLTDNSEGAWVQKEQLYNEGMVSWIDVQYLTEGVHLRYDGQSPISHIWNHSAKEYDVTIGEIDQATVSVIINCVDTPTVSGKENLFRYAADFVLQCKQTLMGLSKIDDKIWLDRVISSRILDEHFEPTLDADVHRAMIDLAFEYELSWMEIGPPIRWIQLDIGVCMPVDLWGSPERNLRYHIFSMGVLGVDMRLI